MTENHLYIAISILHTAILLNAHNSGSWSCKSAYNFKSDIQKYSEFFLLKRRTKRISVRFLLVHLFPNLAPEFQQPFFIFFNFQVLHRSSDQISRDSRQSHHYLAICYHVRRQFYWQLHPVCLNWTLWTPKSFADQRCNRHDFFGSTRNIFLCNQQRYAIDGESGGHATIGWITFGYK
jgi:hypothetical protein